MLVFVATTADSLNVIDIFNKVDRLNAEKREEAQAQTESFTQEDYQRARTALAAVKPKLGY
jgi:hypothetical protein